MMWQYPGVPALLLTTLLLAATDAVADALIVRAESSHDSDDVDIRRGVLGTRSALSPRLEFLLDGWHREIESPVSNDDSTGLSAGLAGKLANGQWRFAAGAEQLPDWIAPVVDGGLTVRWRGNEIEAFVEAGLVETPQAVAQEIDARLYGATLTRENGPVTWVVGGHRRDFSDGNARNLLLGKMLVAVPKVEALHVGLAARAQEDDMFSPAYFSPERYRHLQALVIWKGVIDERVRWRLEGRVGHEWVEPFAGPAADQPVHAVVVGAETPLGAHLRIDCTLSWQDAATSESGAAADYEYAQANCGARRDF